MVCLFLLRRLRRRRRRLHPAEKEGRPSHSLPYPQNHLLHHLRKNPPLLPNNFPVSVRTLKIGIIQFMQQVKKLIKNKRHRRKASIASSNHMNRDLSSTDTLSESEVRFIGDSSDHSSRTAGSEEDVKTVRVNNNSCGNYSTMCIFVACLAALVFWGKALAIATCTSSCLFFGSSITRHTTDHRH